MARTQKQVLVDSDGNLTGNSWTSSAQDEDATFQSLLEDQDDGCPFCGFDGQLRSTRKGYKCPECREIVIPVDV
jgi:hypothetical protein